MWVWERRNAREYWPCRARGGILQLIYISGKDAWSLSARKGQFLKQEGLGLPHCIPFSFQRNIFKEWLEPQLDFSLSLWPGLGWPGLCGRLLRLIRCCGRGHAAAGTEVTWAGWGPSQAAVTWSTRTAQPHKGRRVSTCGVAPWVMASPSEFLLLLWALGTPGEAEREQPAGMARS